MSEDSQRRRSARRPVDETKPIIRPSSVTKKDGSTSNEKLEIVWYDAETWEETTDGIRKLMSTIESSMDALETKMNKLLRKYEECAKLKRMIKSKSSAPAK